MTKSDLSNKSLSNDLSITNNMQSLEISFLLKQKIKLEDIKVIVNEEKKVLNINLIDSVKKNYDSILKEICEIIVSLNLKNIDIVGISWYFSEQDDVAWGKKFELSDFTLSELEIKKETKNKSKSSWWKGISSTVDNLKQNIETQTSKVNDVIASTASKTVDMVVNTSLGTGKAIASTASKTGDMIVNTSLGTGKAIASTASKTGDMIVNTSLGTGKAIASTASKTGDMVVNTTLGIGKAIASTASKTGDILGNMTKEIVDNPLFEKIIDQVDLEKAEIALNKLQDKYPEENSFQIAHRLMREKVILAGSSGLVSGLIPGAAAFIALDLTAMASLQAEMVYQISGCYGFDLKEKERKGEVLSIFALALGSSYGINAGLKIFQLTPVIGSLIGASTNIAMLYSVGYAACKFYELKLNNVPVEEIIIDSAEASEKYLQLAITQEIIMDQVLVHFWLASNPDKSLSDLLPLIDQLNLSPASLTEIQEIARKEKEAIPLKSLLEEINQDFAVSLLVKCEELAKVDGIINDGEAEILALINQKLENNK